MAFDRKYMELAIELAKKGIGKVNPNPLVGAVIVKDGKIIGQGYHKAYGGLHAEREAFASLSESAEGAEMYVTLEPCCHHGKQPPCTEAIVENKIKKVYVGSDDPNGLVNGKGYEYLRNHGVEVETHVMKEECDRLNPVFFHYISKKTPYVVMKYGMTMDGKTASYTGKSKWITNESSRERVQELRNYLKGIMVGIGTVLADNPSLTCRIEDGRNPVRIICDSRLRIPTDSNIVKTALEVPTYVAALSDIVKSEKNKVKCLEEAGVKIIALPPEENASDKEKPDIDLRILMQKLGEYSIDGILLEGGGTLNYSMLDNGLVNEVRVFMAPKILGGDKAKSPVEGRGRETPDLAYYFKPVETELIDKDIYIRYIKD